MKQNITVTPVVPRTPNQTDYLNSIKSNVITIAIGFAGCGKSYIALNAALSYVTDSKEKYKKVIIIRPYVTNNGHASDLGALPGNFKEKFLPFSEAIRDNLSLIINSEDIRKLTETGVIEYAIPSMCRGRNFSKCIVLVDEAQNLENDAVKMLITRIDRDCKMIFCGDLSQSDLPKGRNALHEAITILNDIKGIGIVQLNDFEDIQRNPIIREVLKRYIQISSNKVKN